MKVNRKVSDLARKLNYLDYSIKERRNIIQLCMFPLLNKRNLVTNQINESYYCIKQLGEIINETDKRLNQNEQLLYLINRLNKKTKYNYSYN